MSFSVSSISSAISALRMYGRGAERAAETIAAAGLSDPTDPAEVASAANTAAPAQPVTSADMSQAMITILIAQRAVSANLQALKSADEMAMQVVDFLGDAYGPKSTPPA